MKKLLFGLAACFALSLLCQQKAQAQLLVPASLADNTWYNSLCPGGPGVYIAGINTAMIDFPGSKLTKPPLPAGSLMVSDYYGNGTAGGVSFRDLNSGFTVTIPYCTTGNYFTNSPDIIVGNDLTNPSTDFRVAVAYVNLIGGGTQPQIDYYRVHYFSAVGFTVTPMGSTIFAPFNTSTIHLDIIAAYGNTALTGLPLCDTFSVTWNDWSTHKSYARLCTLSLPPAFIGYGGPTIQLMNAGATAMAQPDVAAIQRTIPCAGCSYPHNMSLFVTSDEAYSQLYYQEYDWVTGAFTTGAPVLLDPGPYGYNNLWYPRIDAPDNFAVNDPAIPGRSYYKAVAQVFNGTAVASYTYDNQTGIGPQDDGAYLQPGSMPYSPTVAYGGNGGTQYQVSHYEDAYGGVPNVYMEPINWMAPGQFSPNIPDFVGFFQPYFQINMLPPMFVNGNYLNAISTPCNNPSHYTLCAWAYNDPSIPMSTVFYKVSPYGGPWGYSFRETPNAVAQVQKTEWKVFPNPATSTLTVEYPVPAGTYEITDMLGRTLLHGTLQAGKQDIDLQTLAPGSYIISVSNSNGENDHASFIKE